MACRDPAGAIRLGPDDFERLKSVASVETSRITLYFMSILIYACEVKDDNFQYQRKLTRVI